MMVENKLNLELGKMYNIIIPYKKLEIGTYVGTEFNTENYEWYHNFAYENEVGNIVKLSISETDILSSDPNTVSVKGRAKKQKKVFRRREISKKMSLEIQTRAIEEEKEYERLSSLISKKSREN